VSAAYLPSLFTGHPISRSDGAEFLGNYVASTGHLVPAAHRRDVLRVFSAVMEWSVPPLTLVTTAVVTRRALRSASTGD
jgi:hypothetical protein